MPVTPYPTSLSLHQKVLYEFNWKQLLYKNNPSDDHHSAPFLNARTRNPIIFNIVFNYSFIEEVFMTSTVDITILGGVLATETQSF